MNCNDDHSGSQNGNGCDRQFKQLIAKEMVLHSICELHEARITEVLSQAIMEKREISIAERDHLMEHITSASAMSKRRFVQNLSKDRHFSHLDDATISQLEREAEEKAQRYHLRFESTMILPNTRVDDDENQQCNQCNSDEQKQAEQSNEEGDTGKGRGNEALEKTQLCDTEENNALNEKVAESSEADPAEPQQQSNLSEPERVWSPQAIRTARNRQNAKPSYSNTSKEPPKKRRRQMKHCGNNRAHKSPNSDESVLENDSEELELEAELIDQPSLCDDLLTRFNQCKEDPPIVVAQTRLLKTIQHRIKETFNPRQFRRSSLIQSITKDVTTLLEGLTEYNQLYKVRDRIKSDQLASEPDFSIQATLGSMLCACEKRLDNALQEEPEEVTVGLERIETAISAYYTEKGIAKDVNAREFIRLGHPTTNLMTHLYQLSLMDNTFKYLTLYQVLSGFSRGRCQEYLRRAEQLAQSVDPEFILNEPTALLEFLDQIVAPGLVTLEHRALARHVTCDIKKNLTETRGKERGETLRGAFHRGQYTTPSGEIKENGKDYCGGPDKTLQRLRITTLYFTFFLQKAIQAQLPPGTFGKRGFILSILRLSATDVYEACNGFLTPAFFDAVHTKDSKVVRNINEKILIEKLSNDDDTGERTVVIKSKAQINSLGRLLEGNGEAGLEDR